MEHYERLRRQMVEAQQEHEAAIEDQTAVAGRAALAEAHHQRAMKAYVRELEREVDRLRALTGQGQKDSAGEEDAGIDMRPVLLALNSGNHWERLEAKQAIENLGPRAVGPLLRLLSAEAHLSRRSRFVPHIAIAATGLALGGMMYFSMMLLEPGGSFLIFAFLLAFLAWCVSLTRPTALQRTAAQMVAGYDSARAVPPLIEALSFDDVYTVKIALTGIKRLLPRLRHSDAPLFETEHLEALYKRLQSSDRKLVIAILDGLSQIGDESALPFVEQVMERPIIFEEDTAVHDAAKACTPALLSRTKQDAASKILLRPAAAHVAERDVLLRATKPVAEVDVETLLRPSQDSS